MIHLDSVDKIPAEEAVKIEKTVLKTIERYTLLKREEKVLVGFSGGADSLCLTHILHTLSEKGGFPLRLHLCHVNHRLRPESDRDEEFCRNLARDLEIPIKVKHLDLTRKRGTPASGTEERARAARYSALLCAADEVGAKKVAVAHTRDDQAETVLMRLLRGTGLRGLAGILPLRRISPESEVLLVRPLIEITRAEVLRYLTAKNLNWVEDATNRDTNFLRNRIRQEILPQIEKICGFSVRESLARLACLSLGIRPILDARAQELAKSLAHREEDGTVQLDLSALRSSSELDTYLVIEEVLKSFSTKLVGSSVARLRTLLERGRSGKAVPLGSGVNAVLEYDRITLARTPKEKFSMPARILNVSGEVAVPELGLVFFCEYVDIRDFNLRKFIKEKGRFEEAIDADAAGERLFVRLPRSGERFRPLGAGGANKISDFLIDRKVPSRLRSLVPVVSGENSVLWLVGYRLDERAKIGKDTKKVIIVRVRAKSDTLTPAESNPQQESK